jgi:hypothetical protein
MEEQAMRERLTAKREYPLTIAIVTGLGAIGLVFLPTVIAVEPTPPTAQGTELILLSKFQPWMIMVMVLGVLAALMGSLLMIYWYIAKVRTTDFHRQILLGAVADLQFDKLMKRARRPRPYYLSGEEHGGEDPDETSDPSQREQRAQRRRDAEEQFNQKMEDFELDLREQADKLIGGALSPSKSLGRWDGNHRKLLY